MEHTRTRWWRLIAALLALALFAGACASDDDGTEAEPDESETTETTAAEEEEEEEATPPAYGGSVTIAVESESPSWTPGFGQFGPAGSAIAPMFFDALIITNGEGEFEPFLAESLEPNDDLTEWTLTLREGVVFHDGTALDAETLKWNLDTLHLADGANTKGALTSAGLTGMEVVDDLTVTYVLSGPNAAFPGLLAGAAGWPVSRAAYEELGKEGFGDMPVGTGPFVVESWVRDDRLVLKRNEDYWQVDEFGQQLPYLDEIVVRPIIDEDSRVQSVQSGDIDIAHTFRGSTGKQFLELTEDDSFGANVAVGNTSGSSILNVLVPPLDDIRVRRAMALANDPEAIAVVLGDDGLVQPTTQFVSADSPWYSATVAEAYPGNGGPFPDEAKELIDEYIADPDRSDGKAVGDPVQIEYTCTAGVPTLSEMSQLLQALWGEIGIEITLKAVDQPALIAQALGTADTDPPYSGSYQAQCWRAGAGDADPLTAMQGFFGPVATTPLNFTNYTNPEIDELLVTLRTAPTFEERYEAFEAINLISAEEVPIIWNVGTPSTVVFRGDIAGIVDWTTPSGAPGSNTLSGRIWMHKAHIVE